MNDHTELAKKFLSDVVMGWMLGDLENMVTKIKPVENGSGNCNFPIALYIFSCMEFLGYLSSDVIIPATRDYTRRRVWSYMNSFFNENYLSQLRPYETSFVSIFRHGLAHEFFAKAAGVSRNTGTLITYDERLKSLVLDADEFYQAFKSSVENLKLVVSQNRNRIADRMLSRYNDLQASNFIRYLPKNILTITKTPTSTASIAEPINLKTTTTLPYDPEVVI